MRVLPTSYIEELKRTDRYKEDARVSKPRRSSQEVAIERMTTRLSVLDAFCKKNLIDTQSSLVKYIKKVFQNPATKNVPIAEYKKELEMIGKAIKEHGMQDVEEILKTNSSRGYKYLIYENQIEKLSKCAKNNANLQEHKISKQVKLNDFDVYRMYLDNPESDDELREFVKEKLGVLI